MSNAGSANKVVDERIKRISILFLLLFSVPILGWLTSLYVESNFESQFRQAVVGTRLTDAEYIERGVSYLKLCGKNGTLRNDPESKDICSFAEEIEDARLASLVSAGLGIGLLVLIFGAKAIAGTNRKKLAVVFSSTVRLVMLILAVSVITQAGLFIYSIYTLEAAAIQRVHGGLLFMIGLGALFGCFQLLKSGLGFFKSEPLSLRAELLTRNENVAIYKMVESLAGKLGAQPPDHIIVGLEPNFFVTSNDVVLIGSDRPKLKGRTLFISLALMRILSKEELAAVIGHELGHFRGQDTDYSLKFAPIYARLSTALNEMSSNGEDAGQLAKLPAVATLGVCMAEFAAAERTVGRERELLADKAGAEAASSNDLATALIKVSLFSDAWNFLTKQHIDILAEGNYYENLAIIYRSICDSYFSDLNWQEAKSTFSEFVQPHPIDTHPPLSQRLQSLGVSIDEINAESGKPSPCSAIELIGNSDELERKLTNLEIKWLVAIGAVVIPQERT